MANSSSLPESCISLFSHIVNAQTIWASRINGTTPSVGVWKVNDPETCKVLLDESVNHGTYHRAQIAKEMKLHNIKPVNTDYIQFVRLQSTGN